jgi:hypothetical protein
MAARLNDTPLMGMDGTKGTAAKTAPAAYDTELHFFQCRNSYVSLTLIGLLSDAQRWVVSFILTPVGNVWLIGNSTLRNMTAGPPPQQE